MAMGEQIGLNGHTRTRVLVLFGGQSGEHDVSLRSAQTVIGALDPERYEVVPVGITREGRWLTGGDPMAALTAHSPLFALIHGGDDDTTSPMESSEATAALPVVMSGQIDVVFPVLHGPKGEDGTVQGMFELSGIPYVGSGVLGSAVAMDKAIAKTLCAQAGIPQVKWLTVLRRDWERDPDTVMEQVASQIGYPCFTKPANMGSSVGVAKSHNAEELADCIAIAARYDRRIIIEQGVDARELEISVLGNEEPIASVVGEIVPSREFYDYEAKYIDTGSKAIIPAEISAETLAEIQRIAIQAFQALDLAGMARADFFLERSTGQLLLNEINTIPGFTSISMYPLLWEASGLPLPELVDRLIALAIERHREKRI